MRENAVAAAPLTNAQLASALAARGVPFVWHEEATIDPTPFELLSGLANSSEARLRLAIIPLLLAHPLLATCVTETYRQLEGEAATTLRFYYTAARLLQKSVANPAIMHGEQLPPLFHPFLTNPDEDLRRLAQLHATATGQPLNWYGTYQHAAQRYLKQISSYSS